MDALDIAHAIDDLAEEFAALGDWEERYAHLIDFARTLAPLDEGERTEAAKVRGCASQVWLVFDPDKDKPDRVYFRGDSDALLVRGLIAMLVRLFSGRTSQEILSTEPRAVFDRIGLTGALTPQRSNGLFAMVARIRAEAAKGGSSPTAPAPA